MNEQTIGRIAKGLPSRPVAAGVNKVETNPEGHRPWQPVPPPSLGDQSGAMLQLILPGRGGAVMMVTVRPSPCLGRLPDVGSDAR